MRVRRTTGTFVHNWWECPSFEGGNSVGPIKFEMHIAQFHLQPLGLPHITFHHRVIESRPLYIKPGALSRRYKQKPPGLHASERLGPADSIPSTTACQPRQVTGTQYSRRVGSF